MAGARLFVRSYGGTSKIGSQYITGRLTIEGDSPIQVTWQADSVARKRTIHLVE
jgi:hypothetical protein